MGEDSALRQAINEVKGKAVELMVDKNMKISLIVVLYTRKLFPVKVFSLDVLDCHEYL